MVGHLFRFVPYTASMLDLEAGTVDRSIADNHSGVGFPVPVRSIDPSASVCSNVLCGSLLTRNS